MKIHSLSSRMYIMEHLLNQTEYPLRYRSQAIHQTDLYKTGILLVISERSDNGLKRDLKMFFRQPIANELNEPVIEMIRHPRAVCTFSDSGAHVSQIMDSSLQTHLLSYWVREKEALTLEEGVRQITYDTATLWGLHDRGLIREGMAADLVIFDPETIGANMPEIVHDLPAGEKRIKQTASGIKNTLVNGEVLLSDNEYMGSTAGELLRS